MEMLEGMMIIWNTSWNNDDAQVGKVRVMSDRIMICSGLKRRKGALDVVVDVLLDAQLPRDASAVCCC